MNINSPNNSRTLAILIQNVDGKDRQQFLEDAKKASSMEDFMKGISRYKTIQYPK